MRKFNGGLLGVVLLLCAFTAQAEEPVVAYGITSIPAAASCTSNDDCDPGDVCNVNSGLCVAQGQICETDSDCAPNEGLFCKEVAVGICSVTQAQTCTTDADCPGGEECLDVKQCLPGCFSDQDCPAGEVCKEEAQTCVECVSDDNCTGNPNGEVCNLDTNTCAECITDSDCAAEDFCERSSCVPFDDCALSIRPNRIKISGKQKRPFVVKLLRFRGNNNFDPKGSLNACSQDADCPAGERCIEQACKVDIVLDPVFVLDPGGTEVRKRLLKIRSGTMTTEKPGLVHVRIGTCPGQIEIQ